MQNPIFTPAEKPPHEPGTTTHFNSFEEAVQHCIQLHESGHWSDAEDGYRQLLLQRPGIPDLMRLRGVALAQMARAEEALPLLQEAVRLSPKQYQSHLHLGFVLQMLGRIEQAAVYFREAARLAPQDPISRVNLSAVLVELQQSAEAVAVARKAASLAPDLLEAQYNLGFALLNNQHPADAIEPFRRAVTIHPGHSESWLHLGLAYSALEMLDDASVAYRQCLQIDPLHTAAANNLANLWQRRGDSEGAVDLYRQILAREPERWEARLSMALALADMERWSEAMELIEGIVPPKNRGKDYRYFRFSILMGQGRKDEARLLLEDEQTQDLQYWMAQYALAEDELIRTSVLAHIEGLPRDKAALKERINALFLLGDVKHNLQDFVKAFSYYAEGQSILKQAEPYDHAQWLQVVDADFKIYSQLQQSACAPTQDAPQPVLIVGMPRSGTSLLEQILDSHAQVSGAGELLDLSRIAALLRSPQQIESPNLLPQLRNQYLQSLQKVSADARYVTDKMPHNFAHMGVIALLFPQAPILICRRDPRDNALSIWRQHFLGQHAYSHDLQNLAQHYVAHLNIIERWCNQIPNPVLEVNYESLVTDSKATIQSVLDFLNLPWDENCLRFYENPRKIRTASRAQVNKPLYRSSLEQWRAYSEYLEPFCAELVSAGIILKS